MEEDEVKLSMRPSTPPDISGVKPCVSPYFYVLLAY